LPAPVTTATLPCNRNLSSIDIARPLAHHGTRLRLWQQRTVASSPIEAPVVALGREIVRHRSKKCYHEKLMKVQLD